jgi:Tfp pilus assembly protein PilV
VQRSRGRQGRTRPCPPNGGKSGVAAFVATPHASTGVARRRSSAGQAGYSLVESLVAIMLVTTVILGIAAGILTTVRATRTVSLVQKNEAALTDATEQIKAAPYDASSCTPTYTTTVSGVQIRSVEFLDVPSAVASPGTQTRFAANCAANIAQRVTIRVDGRDTDIVKRNPAYVTP